MIELSQFQQDICAAHNAMKLRANFVIGVTHEDDVYDDISHTPFAQGLLAALLYAQYGKETGELSDIRRVTATMEDMAASSFMKYHFREQQEILASIQTCTHVVKLAEARRVLEDDAGELTFRQLSLLSGYPEMTLRSFANPKRGGMLHAENQNGHTKIKSLVAKAWLKSKNKNVEITHAETEKRIVALQNELRELHRREALLQRELSSLVATQ